MAMRICRLQMDIQVERMASMGISLSYDDDVVHMLCEKGYSAEYGVRAIKRAINKYIVDGLAEALTHDDISIHKPILVSGQVNRIVIANG